MIGTWTFFGHWESDRLVIEYVVDGEVNDPRQDTGYWEEGLWCDTASAETQELALAQLREEYEAPVWEESHPGYQRNES